MVTYIAIASNMAELSKTLERRDTGEPTCIIIRIQVDKLIDLDLRI